MPINHDEVTAIVSAQGGYGKGITPNPYAESQSEWARRKATKKQRKEITKKIEMLMEPRFVTFPETAECIEAIITMTDSRKILELGMCTGFGTLHMLRAVIGKPGAKVVSVEPRPCHDIEFFSRFPIFSHMNAWTPDALTQLHGEIFDLVFVDSDHSVEHTIKEVEALKPITRKGSIFLFHDMPEWQSPSQRVKPGARLWLEELSGLKGCCLPSCEQPDCLATWGAGYPKECNPGLGIFIRPQ